jgi:hypothetical protein
MSIQPTPQEEKSAQLRATIKSEVEALMARVTKAGYLDLVHNVGGAMNSLTHQ